MFDGGHAHYFDCVSRVIGLSTTNVGCIRRLLLRIVPSVSHARLTRCVPDCRFLQLVKPEDGDDYKDHCFCEEDNFKFFLLTQNLTPEDELLRLTLPIKVV